MKKNNYYLAVITFFCFVLFSISCSKDKPEVILDEDPPIALDEEYPKVTLLSTSGYVTKAGTIKIVANATDNIGVTKVEFYSGSNLIGTDMEAPFELSREYSSTAYGDEKYHVFAYDAAGNKSRQSEEITIRVNVERATPILELSLQKTIFSPEEAVSPKAVLKGAPYQSGTIEFATLGENCSGTINYANSKSFTDGVMPSTWQFNNGVVAKRSISARVLIAGKSNVISNCLNYTVAK